MIPKYQKSIDNCTKDKVCGNFLRPPHKDLTPATVYIINYVDISLKQIMQQKSENCSLGLILTVHYTVMKGATLSKPHIAITLNYIVFCLVYRGSTV